MVELVLIYPYTKPSRDNSIFRFPPLGLGYIASFLRKNGISVKIIDYTFKNENEASEQVRKINPSVIGIYSMFTLENNSIKLAKSLRGNCDLLVAGGPLPSVSPVKFLQNFDIVVVGEGEKTMLEITKFLRGDKDLSQIAGIVYKGKNGKIVYNPSRDLMSNLDDIPFPARDLFDNEAYQIYYKRAHRSTTTSMMSSRGCPFTCDFCSKPVFSHSYRERSAENVVDEIEDVLSYGYECVFFQDDCFTLNEKRVKRICEEIQHRRLNLGWYCLSRVDSINKKMLANMRRAGCKQIFFGIESGNNSVLNFMKKQFTIKQARKAVELTVSSGIKTGAFFILGYPGETEETILDTIRFATSLPVDYLSFTLPYPIPGTGLYEKVNSDLKNLNLRDTDYSLIDHTLIFKSKFSEKKLKFAIAKAMIQYNAKKHMGSFYFLFREPFEVLTDKIFKALR